MPGLSRKRCERAGLLTRKTQVQVYLGLLAQKMKLMSATTNARTAQGETSD